MRYTLASLLLLAACKVGTPEDGPPSDSGGDGAVDAFDQTACVDRPTPADPAHIHTDDSTTKVGQTCATETACHAAGSANHWLYSGTIYDAAGTTPQPGVLVRVRTSDPMRPLRAVTDDAGNFHFVNIPTSSTQMLLTFPTRVEVTACPDVTMMNRDVTSAADLNCTNGTCHAVQGERIKLTL